MTHILRLGIAGLGVASTQILPPLAKLPFIKITAAADTRTDALAKFRQAYGGEGHSTVEDLCRNANVDAVYIATPNALHAEHAITAAKHGKHIIVEKPMAMTLAECDAMNEAAEKHGVKLLCGHTHSFDPPIRKIREIVKGGELGKLCMINTWNFNEFMYRPRMKHELAMSRGVVLNQGPHHVDIVQIDRRRPGAQRARHDRCVGQGARVGRELHLLSRIRRRHAGDLGLQRLWFFRYG